MQKNPNNWTVQLFEIEKGEQQFALQERKPSGRIVRTITGPSWQIANIAFHLRIEPKKLPPAESYREPPKKLCTSDYDRYSLTRMQSSEDGKKIYVLKRSDIFTPPLTLCEGPWYEVAHYVKGLDMNPDKLLRTSNPVAYDTGNTRPAISKGSGKNFELVS